MFKRKSRSGVPAIPRPQHTQVARFGHNGGPPVQAGYMRDLSTPFLFGWNPVLREPVDETMEAWILAAGKAVETIHNSGFISGGIDTAVAQQVGTGLQLDLQPDPAVFGGDAKATQDWARVVERRFMDYANDAWSVDLGGRYTLGQIQAQAVKQQIATGEVVASLPFVNRVGSTHGTKINLMPSSRLSQTTDQMKRAVQGVILDQTGAPAGYMFNHRDPVTFQTTDITVAARDVNGRPVVAHLLDAAPSATRGMTPLVPVLRVIRQYDQLADATLTAALLQTVFAATIESDAPTKELMQALQSQSEQEDLEDDTPPPNFFQRFMQSRGLWYKNTNIDLGQKAKMVHLYPGEKLNFNKSEHPNTGYNEFSKGLLREIARCLGITYEQLTGDFSGATYSSVRMAIADTWLITTQRRQNFPARLAQIVFEAWLEEEIERGLTPFPGGVGAFLTQRQAVCRANWRGPPKPTADDLKTAKANQIARSEGWVSTAQVAAEYGNDWLDVAEAQQREMQDRKERDLPPLPAMGSVAKADPAAVDPVTGQPRKPEREDDDEEEDQ